jgi:hypothetical protein
MALSQEQKVSLIDAMKGLSAGDLSTIAVILKTPDSQLRTTKTSANFVFFSKLQEYGYSEQFPIDDDLPPAMLDKFADFSIREDAKPELILLLKQGRPEYAEALQKTLDNPAI